MTGITRRRFLESIAGGVVWSAAHLAGLSAAGETSTTMVGAAKVDITPNYPIRLSGFGFRRQESEGVTHPIWAKALAIGAEGESPAILVTVDNLGVPDYMVCDLAKRLKSKAGVDPARVAVSSTHTHTAPMLAGVAPTLFGEPIPPDHQAHIEQYTKELTDHLERVALAAIADRTPSWLEWGFGSVGFAINRRATRDGRVVGIGVNPKGPVDHDMPLLVVKSPAGKVRAVYASYACHCVTLSNNKIGGDWAGFAQLAIEKQWPGAVSLISIGCGADINPSSGVTGDKVEVAAEQGQQIAAEVKRLICAGLQPLCGKLVCRLERIDLAFDTPPTREEWQRRAGLPKENFYNRSVAYHAKIQLERLDRGEALQTYVSYPIQTWAFGNQMAMVFLPGEVVVDYSLRLKRELGAKRLWVNGYSNDVPCYIPSERILKEGGYEGGDAMRYFDRPTKFKPGLECQIVDVVHRQLDGTLAKPMA
ncbi:MAG: neutral/alkaline non-lysosomal ceramidase N-terminal domain-containing protein [Planctomycetota bacterium]|jgi:hypothetical protein